MKDYTNKVEASDEEEKRNLYSQCSEEDNECKYYLKSELAEKCKNCNNYKACYYTED